MEIQIGYIGGHSGSRIENNRTVGSASDFHQFNIVTVNIRIIGQNSDVHYGIFISSCLIIGSHGRIIDRKYGDADGSQVGIQRPVIGPERKTVRPVIVGIRGIGHHRPGLR